MIGWRDAVAGQMQKGECALRGAGEPDQLKRAATCLPMLSTQ